MLMIRRALVQHGYLQVESASPNNANGGASNHHFATDIEAGLTSDNFDTLQNLLDGDDRPGLDADDVKLIMEQERCSFDQARLIRQKRIMRRNNIDPDTGMPLDPKAVFFAPPTTSKVR